MNEIIENIESLASQLNKLEGLMSKADFQGKSIDDLLGSNPKVGFSRLVEFKVALDRMRGLTWVYMEAAASATKLPAHRIPQALNDFLQQQATRTQANSVNKKTR